VCRKKEERMTGGKKVYLGEELEDQIIIEVKKREGRAAKKAGVRLGSVREEYLSKKILGSILRNRPTLRQGHGSPVDQV